jgi:UDP-N-acetylglucosamine acyltransferase
VDPGARLGSSVVVGAFAVVEAGARVGDGTSIGHHAVVHGGVSLGSGNVLYPHCVVGGEPGDAGASGLATRLEIGDRNQIREFTTLHRGSVAGGGLTRVGSDNLFMAYSSVAQDCAVADHVILVNCSALAGGCVVGSHAVLGGLAMAEAGVRIGTFAMVGGMSKLSKDVPPYSTTSGCEDVKVYGLNKLGLRRQGVGKADMEALEAAYRVYQDPQADFAGVLARMESLSPRSAQVGVLVGFLRSSGPGVYR